MTKNDYENLKNLAEKVKNGDASFKERNYFNMQKRKVEKEGRSYSFFNF
jgi:hypothetical protein